MKMFIKYFSAGAICTALAIAFGAFGAHGLKEIVSEHMLQNFETGVRYQMYSALGLMLIALASKHMQDHKKLAQGSILILIGMIIFSGSLYVMALTGVTMLGAITPIGGVLLIAGWVFVVWGVLKNNSH